MRVLIVEDELVAQTKMKSLLENIGFCDLARDGKEAFYLFQQAYLDSSRYDLMTIDIDIPYINGLELLKLINTEESQLLIPPAKKIIITSSSSTNHVFLAKEYNCDAYIMKPVRKESLKEKLIQIGFLKESL
jgi:YesN/AraC family two-component response regulator